MSEKEEYVPNYNETTRNSIAYNFSDSTNSFKNRRQSSKNNTGQNNNNSSKAETSNPEIVMNHYNEETIHKVIKHNFQFNHVQILQWLADDFFVLFKRRYWSATPELEKPQS